MRSSAALSRGEREFQLTPSYNDAHVAASAHGTVGSLVLYHLPDLAAATASFGFRIRHPGAERRAEHAFLLTAWVFLPDHWHAIFYPRHPLSISRVVEVIKDGATKRINQSRRETGALWQPRFFDRALRTVEEYNATVKYIHLNPVTAGLIHSPEEWSWSSVHDYTGSIQRPVTTPARLVLDRILLPADKRTRI